MARNGPARADEGPKWGASFDLEAKPGSARSVGTGDLFVPIAQNNRGLLFGDMRGRFDDKSSQEGNFGLGYRFLGSSGWNLGAYGYFDVLHSPHDNLFYQTTGGVEALSVDWDLRANGYLPVGPTSRPASPISAGAQLVGTTIEIVRSQQIERALAGFDAEIGWRVPLWNSSERTQLRIFAGGYHFGNSGARDITGPRGRIEFTLYDIGGLWKGARLTLGGEAQHDGPRGTTGFGLFRLRIPFGTSRESSNKLSLRERRMTDPVVRDIDVVSTPGATGTMEVARDANGTLLKNIAIVKTSQGQTTLQNALNTGSPLVILDGDSPSLGVAGNGPTGITLAPNQTLLGGGGSMPVTGVRSGRQFAFVAPGGRPTVQATSTPGPDELLTAASGSSVRSIDFTGGEIGVMVPDGSTGVVVQDNTFAGHRVAGVMLIGVTQNTFANIASNKFTMTGFMAGVAVESGLGFGSASITNNRFIGQGGTGPLGIVLDFGTTTTISNNTFAGAFESGAGFLVSAFTKLGPSPQIAGSGNDLTGMTSGVPCFISGDGLPIGSIGLTVPGGAAGSIPTSCVPAPDSGGGGGGIITIGTFSASRH
jgi:hypothetical protein